MATSRALSLACHRCSRSLDLPLGVRTARNVARLTGSDTRLRTESAEQTPPTNLSPRWSPRVLLAAKERWLGVLQTTRHDGSLVRGEELKLSPECKEKTVLHARTAHEQLRFRRSLSICATDVSEHSKTTHLDLCSGSGGDTGSDNKTMNGNSSGRGRGNEKERGGEAGREGGGRDEEERGGEGSEGGGSGDGEERGGEGSEGGREGGNGGELGTVAARLHMVFTCKVCSMRSAHQFSKHSYENGVVLVRCPGCQNIHLIADNLGWFQSEKINVEALLAARGERVKRKEDSSLDTIELSPEDILGNSQLHNIVKGDSS